jgi:hypothetical protein
MSRSQQEQQKLESTTNPPAVIPAFPDSKNCTQSQPCTNVAGEVIRIEESYWIKQPNGQEIHLKVTRDTNMQDLPKVGDTVAAQITSTGNAEAIVKLQQVKPRPSATMAPTTQGDLRSTPDKR